MEALTGVAVALLTIYDMCKAVDKKMRITDIRLLKKDQARSCKRQWSNGVMRRNAKRSRDSESAISSHPLQSTLQSQITVGIITISDRAAAGEYGDLGGPALKEAAQEQGWQVLC